ncbi:hypothetical protein BJ742DRAFT_735545 [Cladochytrium replicatum]|nr:hypothetical protein BJ742DRAFT_735545 [Cladochytrium replicatum]
MYMWPKHLQKWGMLQNNKFTSLEQLLSQEKISVYSENSPAQQDSNLDTEDLEDMYSFAGNLLYQYQYTEINDNCLILNTILHQIFISHRKTDAAYARSLALALDSKSHGSLLDSIYLVPGKDWLQGFFDGILRSSVVKICYWNKSVVSGKLHFHTLMKDLFTKHIYGLEGGEDAGLSLNRLADSIFQLAKKMEFNMAQFKSRIKEISYGKYVDSLRNIEEQ